VNFAVMNAVVRIYNAAVSEEEGVGVRCIVKTSLPRPSFLWRWIGTGALSHGRTIFVEALFLWRWIRTGALSHGRTIFVASPGARAGLGTASAPLEAFK